MTGFYAYLSWQGLRLKPLCLSNVLIQSIHPALAKSTNGNHHPILNTAIAIRRQMFIDF